MQAESSRAVIAALFANLGIAIAKVVGFVFTGAASMLAEAIHSFADSSNQGLLFLGEHDMEMIGGPGKTGDPSKYLYMIPAWNLGAVPEGSYITVVACDTRNVISSEFGDTPQMINTEAGAPVTVQPWDMRTDSYPVTITYDVVTVEGNTYVESVPSAPALPTGEAAAQAAEFCGTAYLFDNVPGGVGLAERIHERAEWLIARAAELCDRCTCEVGCPCCVGANVLSAEAGTPLDPALSVGARKASALRLLGALGFAPPEPC